MNTPVASVGADGRAYARTGHRGLSGRAVRWGMMVAITVGVFFGAMACATNVAAGDGHGAHAAVGQLPNGHSDPGRHGHDSATVSVDVDPSTSSDRAPESPTTTQGHPGMACVTSAHFHVPALVVPAGGTLTSARSATTPPDVVTELEPPVPRFS